MEMNPNKLVKALRCCAKGLGHDDACENCKVGEIQDRRGYIEFAAANVIERLTAENAALREKVYSMSGEWCAMMSVLNSIGSYERLRELAEADKDGRVVVLPCKVGERWVDEDGRAVRITAVIVRMEPFGENINIYFDYEDATPDDAGSDCVTNWDHFSRLFTCAETVLDNRKDADDD